MFSLFKKKVKAKTNIVSPIDGKLIKLEEVKDPVFAQKMMGDGFAIIPSGDAINTVYAPVDGTIASLPATKHAVGIKTQDDREILIHIGIDTVNLNGKGFESFVNQGDQVHQGDKLISFDDQVLLNNQLDNTVMIILVKGFNKVKLNQAYGNEIMHDTDLMN